MHYVYVLVSLKTKGIYIGYTNNLKSRIYKHNTNKGGYTKNKGPWKLVYCEMYRSKDDALKRERRLKYYGQALNELKKRINDSLFLTGLVRDED